MASYTTTRGGGPVELRTAVLGGTAPDGGLYVPNVIPTLGPAWPAVDPQADDLRTVAEWAAPLFFPSLPARVATAVARDALDFPVPLVEVEPGRFVLELFHGPTHAFKDVGARFMARLLQELPQVGPRTVLVATSGDTGGAVAHAFHGVDDVSVVVLFPAAGVSERQRRQMTTLGDNVHAVAVEGTFDDCQRMVKEAFADPELSARRGLMSANSINVARLMPQALYYVHAAARLGATAAETGHRAAPWFVVPSGNLGNLCAGLVAWRAGMPASGFTAAANVNRGFVDFLAGADFEPRPSTPTASSAMDVGAPSNLERLRWLFRDDDALRGAVRGVSVDGEETTSTIRRVHAETGYVLDPHTAVAYAAAMRHDAPTEAPVVVLATAHPAKFPETVEATIGRRVPMPPGLVECQGLPEHMDEMAPSSEALAAYLEHIAT